MGDVGLGVCPHSTCRHGRSRLDPPAPPGLALNGGHSRPHRAAHTSEAGRAGRGRTGAGGSPEEARGCPGAGGYLRGPGHACLACGWWTCEALLDLRRLLVALEAPGPAPSCKKRGNQRSRGKGSSRRWATQTGLEGGGGGPGHGLPQPPLPGKKWGPQPRGRRCRRPGASAKAASLRTSEPAHRAPARPRSPSPERNAFLENSRKCKRWWGRRDRELGTGRV